MPRTSKPGTCRRCPTTLPVPREGGTKFCTPCVELKAEETRRAKLQYVKDWKAQNPGYQKRRYSENPEHYRAKAKEYRRNNPDAELRYRVKGKFGLSFEQYTELLEQQGHVCAICEQPESSPRHNNQRLSVDHDHVTGRVRGLLCNNCNRALGLLKDSPTVLRQATDYLERKSS